MNQYQQIAIDQLARAKSSTLVAELARRVDCYEEVKRGYLLTTAHLEIARRAVSGMNGGRPTCALGNLAACEFKFVDFKAGHFTAYAATFRKPGERGDCVNDRILPGSFNDDLKAYGDERPMYFQHDPNLFIGTAKGIHEDFKGLKFHGHLERDNSFAMEIRDALDAKVLSEMSIGYRATDYERPTENDRVIKRIRLDEISVVTAACDWLARVVSP